MRKLDFKIIITAFLLATVFSMRVHALEADDEFALEEDHALQEQQAPQQVEAPPAPTQEETNAKVEAQANENLDHEMAHSRVDEISPPAPDTSADHSIFHDSVSQDEGRKYKPKLRVGNHSPKKKSRVAHHGHDKIKRVTHVKKHKTSKVAANHHRKHKGHDI